MITLENNSKRMVVLSAMSVTPLRLFPGQNNVDFETLDEFKEVYLKGNKAAQAIAKECIRTIDAEDVNWEVAEYARGKNNDMNKAAKALMVAEEKIIEKDKENASLADVVKQLKKEVAALKKEKKVN